VVASYRLGFPNFEPMKYFFIGLAIYFLYRFIFNFIIPIYRVSKKMKGQMRDFQSQMNQNGQGFQPNPPRQEPAPGKSTKEGEYIDFEEIK
jgi:hypothetical protein